jgi:hypothetical protein
MLKGISRSSFQRSSATHFGTLSAGVTPFFAHGGCNVVAEKRDFQIMQPTQRTTTAGNRVGNKILLSIPDKEYALILPHLEFLSMPHHLSLYEPGQPLEFAHFPNTGMVSLVIATEDGKTVEVGEVGREGFSGIQAAVGINRNKCARSYKSPETGSG